MATVTSIICDGKGETLATTLRFIRQGAATYNDVGQLLSRAVVMTRTGSNGVLSVVVTEGRWLFTYPCGNQSTRGMIDVPAGDGSYDLDGIRVEPGSGGRLGTLYYGTSESETVDEAA